MFQAPNLVGSRDCLPSQAGAWAPETEPAQPFRFLSPSIVPQKQKREWFASLLSAPVQQHPHIESVLTALHSGLLVETDIVDSSPTSA